MENPRPACQLLGVGILPEKFDGGCTAHFPKPISYNDQILGFSLPHLWPDQKFGTLFMTVSADIVAQNIIFEDLLFMVLLIMMKN